MKKKNKARLSMYTTLVLYALVPLITVLTVLGLFVANYNRHDTINTAKQSLVSINNGIGYSIDYFDKMCNNTVKTFATAPIVTEYLKNPDNPELEKKAQDYTVKYFNALNDWEGIYIADWNSKVLTHPAPPVIGKVMREGDRLEQLRNDMLSVDEVLDYGIITSPASGELIISMYYVVKDENNKPIGYVGAGAFLKPICISISDVSNLGYESAHLYIVDNDGSIVYHPDETKIGQPIEEDDINNLLEKLNTGEYMGSTVIDNKDCYKVCYPGYNNNYLSIIYVTRDDIISGVSTSLKIICGIAGIGIILFAILALFIGKVISDPLKEIAKSALMLSEGNVNVECNAKSHIKETVGIIDAVDELCTNISKAVNDVTVCTNEVESAVGVVSLKTENNTSSVNNISEAVNEVSLTSQQVAESAQEINEKTEKLGNNIDMISTSVEALRDSSDKIEKANHDASIEMGKALKSSEQSAEAVNNIVLKINETSAAIDKIKNCVSVISEITDQTNLLSLNASIEAARAGESGRGFAVVAQEIRSLSDASKESAEEISNVINSIIGLFSENVSLANEVKDIIDKEVNAIVETQDKFKTLSGLVESSVNEIQSINGMVEDLTEIKQVLVSATVDLSAMSEELGAGAEEASASCSSVSIACDEALNEVSKMKESNNSLVKAMGFFKV